MRSDQPIIGIDLGTTNSAVAYVDHTGRPTSVLNFEGEIVTPSAILIEDGTAIVGREAKKAATRNVQGYFECFKRSMGEETEPVEINGRLFHPELLSAIVLQRLRNDVARQFGDVPAAVVTVPAFFDEARRRATQNAGRITGLNVVDIINEPTAAAIAYAHRVDQLGHSTKRVERILVYDLGGGTFDTTILEVRFGKEYRTVATDGEVRLGGYDWDARLRDFLAKQFAEKTTCDPLESPDGRLQFQQIAQEVKHSLSVRKSVARPCSFGGNRALLEVTRAKLEELTADLLDRTRTTTDLVIKDADLTWNEIDKVLLTGGSTRMPAVAKMLEELSGKAPDQSLSPDEAVAHGAAVYAKLRTRHTELRVVNVNAHSIRIIGRDVRHQRVAEEMIPKNSALPARKTRLFPVVRAGMRSIGIELCEGETDDPKFCRRIGKVRVEGLPENMPADLCVAVSITCRKDGRIDVNASVRDPRIPERPIQCVDATLDPSLGMNASNIAEAAETLRSYEIV